MADVRSTPLYTAVVTPFKNGAIQFRELEDLLRAQERAGNGVVVLGSTGEGLALSEEEKREVVRFSSSLGLHVPLLAGVGGFQLPLVKEFLEFADALPVDGYLMPVPLYAKPGLDGQSAWFQALLDTVSKPCMIYNVPSRAGVKLQPGVLTRLAGHRNAWSVKEASGSVEEFKAYRKAAPELAFFSGDDALLPEFAAEGAVGLVSVASNAWPGETNRYVRLCLQGKADPHLSLWKAASECLFLASNPVPVKALMKLKGMISSGEVRPPLSERDLESTEELARRNSEIQAWHASL